jgi:hypothetical protein
MEINWGKFGKFEEKKNTLRIRFLSFNGNQSIT